MQRDGKCHPDLPRAIAVRGALCSLAGAWFDVAARTRLLLIGAGAAVMVLVGGSVGFFLDPSRADLRSHYHVGEWGSAASFDRLIHTFDALGWCLAACGIAVVVVMLVQRRRIAAVYGR
jgi:hypothetical protein